MSIPSSNPQYSFLPEDFRVYVGPSGNVINWPESEYEERILPTVNKYTGSDGGYIACYSHNKEGGIYSVDSDIYVMGQMRLQGQYVNGVFHPHGYENQDISAVQDFKDLCNQTFPACKGEGWAGSDTSSWFGFHPDPFDPRDRILDIPIPRFLPPTVDLREWCSPIKNQRSINSCTAHAAVALVEYFVKKGFGKSLNASSLFLYKVTRNLLRKTGDVGANTRTTMKALAMIGVPPEEFWTYPDNDEELKAKVDEEPPAFCYALADRYRSVEYYRIDTRDRTKETVLQYVKAALAANRPLMFGMMAYASCWQQAASTGKFPFPTTQDVRFGGHNMAVVGYDDNMKIRNTDVDGIESTGAFLVKNSYGDQWGDKGYGWVPYDYLLKRQSIDWWMLAKQDWFDTGKFES